MKALGTNYRNAEVTGDFRKLPAGGYIGVITGVEDKVDKEYLNITYDIAEGEFRAFYNDEWGKEHPYAHSFVRSYKQTGDKDKDKKIMGMFKGFLRKIDNDNGTHFEGQAETGLNEKELIGKKLGLVLGYEEYNSDRGEVRERLRVVFVKPIVDIRSGNFEIPEVKRLVGEVGISGVSTVTYTATPPVGFEAISASDIPF